MEWTEATAPDAGDIEAMALAAIEALPDVYRAAARAVALRIEDFAPDDVLDDMRIEDPFELTGLYDGVPLTEKSVFDQPQQPDAIWLNDGEGGFTLDQSFEVDRLICVALIDLNGDARPELILGSIDLESGSGPLEIYWCIRR